MPPPPSSPADLAHGEGITLSASDDALAFVVQQAYDPAYGARPIRRGLASHVARRHPYVYPRHGMCGCVAFRSRRAFVWPGAARLVV